MLSNKGHTKFICTWAATHHHQAHVMLTWRRSTHPNQAALAMRLALIHSAAEAKHIAWHVHALCARFTLWDIGHRKEVYRWATGYYNHAHAIVSYRRPAHPNRSLITPHLVLGQPADEAHCMTCICMICMLRFMIQVRSKFRYTWITRSQDRNHRTHPHHYPTHPNHEPTAP